MCAWRFWWTNLCESRVIRGKNKRLPCHELVNSHNCPFPLAVAITIRSNRQKPRSSTVSGTNFFSSIRFEKDVIANAVLTIWY